jgi:uracil-DNA glycosylase
MDQHLDEESGKSVKSLRALAAAEGECTRCPLYRDATQAVPGEGPKTADFMLVGEQPGDKEDLAGKPFVGPAGRILAQRRRHCAGGHFRHQRGQAFQARDPRQKAAA